MGMLKAGANLEKEKNHRQLEAEKTSSHSRFQPREINDLLAEKEEEKEKRSGGELSCLSDDGGGGGNQFETGSSLHYWGAGLIEPRKKWAFFENRFCKGIFPLLCVASVIAFCLDGEISTTATGTFNY